jgi:hypothetical protein
MRRGDSTTEDSPPSKDRVPIMVRGGGGGLRGPALRGELHERREGGGGGRGVSMDVVRARSMGVRGSIATECVDECGPPGTGVGEMTVIRGSERSG